ncbi:MAG: hypothetical protein B7Z82_03415 [Halothiobacillus sp. 20-54-6]|nr:MAG: hypothetical protein B7Z82_03415 [Halothiobacillus sp. 20-54-6]
MPTRCDASARPERIPGAPTTVPTPLIALTRPVGGNTDLATAILALQPNARLMDWPLLGFEPAADPAATIAALNQISPGDWLVFVSPRAVQFTHALRKLSDLPECHWAAVGTATAAAIRGVFPRVPPIRVPVTTQDSEGLLAALPLAAMAKQRVWIFRGETGRELLIQALRTAGALAQPIAVYRRLCTAWRGEPSTLPTVWVVTAPAALNCLHTVAERLPSADLRRRLLHCDLIVINERTAHQARALGFTGRIALAETPDDAALASTLALALTSALTQVCGDHSLNKQE